jgi:hypothetical protein
MTEITETDNEKFDRLLDATGLAALYQKLDGYQQPHAVSFPCCEPEIWRRLGSHATTRAEKYWLVDQLKSRGLIRQ